MTHRSQRWAGALATLTASCTILALTPIRAEAVALPAPSTVASSVSKLVPTAPAASALVTPALVTPAGHGMGALPSHPDVLTSRGALPAVGSAAAALPSRVDLSANDPKVGDQGRSSSCTAWAIVYGMMGWFGQRSGHSGSPFAPMYAYSQVQVGQDGGSSPTDVLDLLTTQGADTKAHYKHASTDWKHQPNAAERASAAKHKIAGYIEVLDMDEGTSTARATALKTALAAGRPLALGIEVYRNFDNADLKHSLIRGSQASGKVLGLHEVLAVGYDASGIRIMNSWGTAWGAHGYATIDWKYVSRASLDAYTMAGFVKTTATQRPTVTAVSPSQAPLYEPVQVTVTGTRLTNALVDLQGQTIRPDSLSRDACTLKFTVVGVEVGATNVRISTPLGVNLPTQASSFRFTVAPVIDWLDPYSGPPAGGTTVTVSGEYFAGATQVTLADVAVPFTFDGDESLTFVTTPGQPDTCADVIVTTPSGASSPECFYYDYE